MILTLRNRLGDRDRLIDFCTANSHHSFQDLGCFCNLRCLTSPHPQFYLTRNYMIYIPHFAGCPNFSLLSLHDFINVKAPLLLSFVFLLYSYLYIHSPVHFNHVSPGLEHFDEPEARTRRPAVKSKTMGSWRQCCASEGFDLTRISWVSVIRIGGLMTHGLGYTFDPGCMCWVVGCPKIGYPELALEMNQTSAALSYLR